MNMIDSLYRGIGNVLSPRGNGARLSILMYHRILAEKDSLFPNDVTGETFNKQLTELTKAFNVLPLEYALNRLKSGTLPPRSASITFDDGYADNVSIALPILKRHNLHATFFIATAYLNGGCMFNDIIIHAIRHCKCNKIDLREYNLGEHSLETLENKHQTIDDLLKHLKYMPLNERSELADRLHDKICDIKLPTNLMMDNHQLKELKDAGMTIGGHTARHPILAKLSTEECMQEIKQGKDFLENALNCRVNLFAYPNGKLGNDYTHEHVKMLEKMGFKAALTTQWGAASVNSDFFQLPRFTPYAKNPVWFIPMLLKNLIRKDL